MPLHTIQIDHTFGLPDILEVSALREPQHSTAACHAATATAIIERVDHPHDADACAPPQHRRSAQGRGQRRQAVRLPGSVAGISFVIALRRKRDLSAGWDRSGDGCSGSWCWVHYRRTSELATCVPRCWATPSKASTAAHAARVQRPQKEQSGLGWAYVVCSTTTILLLA